MRISRLIIHADAPFAAVANHPLDRLDRPVEEVRLLAGDLEPAAADDPRSPAADLGHPRRAWIVDKTLRSLEQAVDVKPGALAEVEADVVVRSHMRGA